MAYEASGTLEDDGYTDAITVSGWATASAHYDSGTGTMTWQFKGPDGVWRSIYGGAGNTTEQAYTASHCANFFFGGDVQVRGELSSSSSPQVDWQLSGSSMNRAR